MPLTKEEIKYKLKSLKVEFEDGVVKFVLPKTKLTVARYLTRELKLKENGWADHQIRDFAIELEADYQPPTIIECKTPEDYTEMFKAAASCMMVDGDFYRTPLRDQIYKEFNLWPSSWYHYNPSSLGLYTIDGTGKPSARILILDNDKYGSNYGKNYKHVDALLAEAKRRGAVTNTYEMQVPEFRTPSVKISDTYYGPVPHCDNYIKPFNVNFDPDTKEFIFGCKNGFSITNTYKYPGWIANTQIKVAA